MSMLPRRSSSAASSQRSTMVDPNKENIVAPFTKPLPVKPATAIPSSAVPPSPSVVNNPTRLPAAPPAMVKPPTSNAASSSSSHHNTTRRRASSIRQVINKHHEPLVDVKQVDSDESDAETTANETKPQAHQPTSRSSTPAIASAATSMSSFKRSAAVSRQGSDVPAAAGTGFQLMRQINSAASTPTNANIQSHHPWGGRLSLSGSMAGQPFLGASQREGSAGLLSREPSIQSGQISRVGSFSHSNSQCNTPDIRIQTKMQRMEEAQLALEEEVARRHKLFSPENVLVRRWIVMMHVARSAKMLVESGGLRVREYNAVQDARHVLGQLFVPMWLLHNVRRKRKAREVIQRFIFRTIIKRRLRRRHESTDVIRAFLKNKLAMFQHYTRWFKRCVVTIQKAFRRFKCRRDAMVELNLRFIRKAEEMYWNMAAQGAQEVLMERFQAEVEDANKKNSARHRAARVDLVPPALPKNFPTRASLGPIPDSILKKNIKPLISKRSKDWQFELSRRTHMAVESFKRTRRGSLGALMKVPEMSKRCIVVKLPCFRPFLGLEEMYEALDNSVLTLAALRDAPVLTMHLTGGRATPLPESEECFGVFSTQLSELSLKSDRAFESSNETRRCSMVDIFGKH